MGRPCNTIANFPVDTRIQIFPKLYDHTSKVDAWDTARGFKFTSLTIVAIQVFFDLRLINFMSICNRQNCSWSWEVTLDNLRFQSLGFNVDALVFTRISWSANSGIGISCTFATPPWKFGERCAIKSKSKNLLHYQRTHFLGDFVGRHFGCREGKFAVSKYKD